MVRLIIYVLFNMTLHDSPIDTRKTLIRLWAMSFLAALSAVLLLFGHELQLGNGIHLGSNPQREFIFTFLSSGFGFIALILLALTPSLDNTKLFWIFGLALMLRIIAFQASPMLEDDFFRYLWDGKQTAETLSPWTFAPIDFFDDASLSQKWQTILNGINYPDLPTLYGPVLQYLFAAAYFISPGELWPIQMLLAAFDLVILLLLYKHKVGTRWLLAYAIHPLMFKEAISSAHPDGVMVVFLIGSVLFWQRRFFVYTGIFLGLAIATKITALVVLPLLLIAPQKPAAYSTNNQRERRTDQTKIKFWFNSCFNFSQELFLSSYSSALKVIAGLIAVLCLLYIPLLSQSQSNELDSLETFAQHWSFNPLFYSIFEYIPLPIAPRIAAALTVILAVAAIAICWVLTMQKQTSDNAHSLLPPIDLALFCLLILSPVVNNWYWLWVLPLAVLHQRTWLVAACSAGILAYINTSVFYEGAWLGPSGEQPLFHVPWPVTTLQIVIIIACFLTSTKMGKDTLRRIKNNK